MLDLQTVSSFVYENFQSVTTNGTHFHARCPLCGDSKKNPTKKRFHLDYKNGHPIWHCFNCGQSGGFKSLYCRILGITPEEADKRLYKFNYDRMVNQLEKPKTPIRTDPDRKTFNWILLDCVGPDLKVETLLYDHWIKLLEDFRQVRQIPEEIKLYFAFKGRYKLRIIIPIFDGQDIIYFQGRRIPGSDTDPKYKNPVAEKSTIIHNKDKFDRDRYIIVTEGLIDCAMIGNQGTTMLGVEAADEFISTLLSLTDKGVILAYDNDDAGMVALKKFIDGSNYRKRVKYFLMPSGYKECKDINNIRIEHKIGDLYDFVVSNSNDYLTTEYILGGMLDENN